MLADPWAVDIEELWQQAAHNPDKRQLFDALHTYLLDKRQEQIINEKHFMLQYECTLEAQYLKKVFIYVHGKGSNYLEASNYEKLI
ncbi:hypothetical protein Heal19_500100 (plasmid) [Lactiplantibacillus plantarum]|nr:hypothetical protein Heal19_500100 [Lactiplantibacillus plantarum]